MSKYIVLAADNNEFLASFDSSCEAVECAMQFAESISKEACVVEEIGIYKPVLDSYEAAKAYLGEGAKNHQKSLIALEKLTVIAEAWNRQDGFVPDFDNTKQYKWSPGFRKNGTAGFVYDESFTDLVLSPQLCFKSEERARQFGKQFIVLWNDFLLYQ